MGQLFFTTNPSREKEEGERNITSNNRTHASCIFAPNNKVHNFKTYVSVNQMQKSLISSKFSCTETNSLQKLIYNPRLAI
jgi:hypothetical protein